MADEKTPQEMMKEAVEQLKDESAEAVTTGEQETSHDEQPKQEAAEHDTGAEDDGASDVEQRARALGWKPKEEFVGDAVKYVGPDEFIRRQELFDHINAQKKQIKRLEKQQAEVAKYVKSLTESEYTKQLASLKAQRQLALEDGDVTAADKLNDSIADMQVARKQEESQQEDEEQEHEEVDVAAVQAQNQATIQSWMNSNPWYNSDPALHEIADDYAEMFAKNNPDKTLADLLAFVDQKIAKLLPEKDEQGEQDEEVPVKKAISKVTVANRRSAAGVKQTSKKGFSRADLNHTQLSVLNNWILPQKVMTEQEYIDSLAKSGELSK